MTTTDMTIKELEILTDEEENREFYNFLNTPTTLGSRSIRTARVSPQTDKTSIETTLKNLSTTTRYKKLGEGAFNTTYLIPNTGGNYVIQKVDRSQLEQKYLHPSATPSDIRRVKDFVDKRVKGEYDAKVANLKLIKLCCKNCDKTESSTNMNKLNEMGMGVVKMYAVWKYNGNVYSISERCRGGELFDFLGGIYTSWTNPHKLLFCLIIYLKILITLHCLHLHHILHLDIKLENIMFMNTIHKDHVDITKWENTQWKDYTDIKIIDFGLSCTQQRFPAELLSSCGINIVGTPDYVSPVMYSQEASPVCDMWSSTIVLYMMYFLSQPTTWNNDDLAYYTQEEYYSEKDKGQLLQHIESLTKKYFPECKKSDHISFRILNLILSILVKTKSADTKITDILEDINQIIDSTNITTGKKLLQELINEISPSRDASPLTIRPVSPPMTPPSRAIPPTPPTRKSSRKNSKKRKQTGKASTKKN